MAAGSGWVLCRWELSGECGFSPLMGIREHWSGLKHRSPAATRIAIGDACQYNNEAMLYIGLDVRKDSIAAVYAEAGGGSPVLHGVSCG